MDVRPIALLVTAAAQGTLLVAVEIGFRRGLGPETTRQIAHVAGAASVAVLPCDSTVARTRIPVLSAALRFAESRLHEFGQRVHRSLTARPGHG